MGGNATVQVLDIKRTTEGAEVETRVTFPPSDTVEEQAGAATIKLSSASALTSLSTSPAMLAYGSFEPGAISTELLAPPSPPPSRPPPPLPPPPPLDLVFWDVIRDIAPPRPQVIIQAPPPKSGDRNTTLIVAVTLSAAVASLLLLVGMLLRAKRLNQMVHPASPPRPPPAEPIADHSA